MLVTERRQDGSTRERCTFCNKVAKSTQLEAEKAAIRIWAERGFPMRPYFSSKCGLWHLATDYKKAKWINLVKECEVCHKPIAPSELDELVQVMGGFGFAHKSCLNKGETMAEGTQVTRYDEKFAEMAAGYTSGERATGSFISTKGGVLTFAEEALAGNQMCVIVLDYVQERTFYAEKYDASRESALPPVCYAFKRSDDTEEMAPHPSMQADLSYFKPQSMECKSCPNNVFGTADTGKGKACSERRRLALLPAGYYTPRRGSRDFDLHFIEDPQHYATADIAYLKLPVTSVKIWAKYVTQLASQFRRPPVAVVTRVYIEPDAKHQFNVKFEMIEQLPDTLYDVIIKRHEEAKNGIIFGYPPPDAEAKSAASGPIRR